MNPLWTARAAAAVGALSVAYGAWLWFPPAGFIVGGAILLVGGVGALRS